MTGPAGERIQVHLLELPVPLASQAQRHMEELTREFTLIAAGAHDDETDRHLPRRLLDLVDALTRQFAEVSNPPRDRLQAAMNRGDAVIADHVLELPPEAAPAAQAIGDMLDEADEYCRRGQHLLTLSTPKDCVVYRRWYLSQVVRQLAGEAPTSWPAYRQAPGS